MILLIRATILEDGEQTEWSVQTAEGKHLIPIHSSFPVGNIMQMKPLEVVLDGEDMVFAIEIKRII